MNTKLNDAILFYQEKLERKQSRIKPFRELLNKGDELKEKQYAEYKSLEAEINMLGKFIEELRYIGE